MRREDIKHIIEAVMFAYAEPISIKELNDIINEELASKEIEYMLNNLINEYKENNRGIQIIKLQDKYQMCTNKDYSSFIKKVLEPKKKKSLTQTTLETLTIIAYKQPITRIDIDEIRGVKSESAIARLIERGLIKDIGRLEVPGRPILYGTTDEFLRQFGLKTIKELPSLDLYSDEETQSSIDLLNKAIEDMEPEVDDFENNDNENNIEEDVAEEMNEAAIDEDK